MGRHQDGDDDDPGQDDVNNKPRKYIAGVAVVVVVAVSVEFVEEEWWQWRH